MEQEKGLKREAKIRIILGTSIRTRFLGNHDQIDTLRYDVLFNFKCNHEKSKVYFVVIFKY